MLRSIFPVMAAAIIISPACADNHQSKLMKKLAGVWEIEEGKNQGEKLTENEVEGKVIIAENEIVTYDKDEKELYRATFAVDPDTDPIEITMTSMMNGRSIKAYGILKFEEEDNEMWLCYGLPGSPRPKEFKSPGDSKNMLFELQHQAGDAEGESGK